MPSPICLPLAHLDRMTDSTGLIQHAIYSVPRRESGYTTDDNARALRLCARLWNESPDERVLTRVSCYLSFLEHARHPVRGFHNFLSYQRDWLDAGGTGDCQGQAVLALAEVLGSNLPSGIRSLARELLDGALPVLAELRSLRAQAYVIQAWAMLRRATLEDTGPMEDIARCAADRLVDCFQRSQRPDWHWFEVQMIPGVFVNRSNCPSWGTSFHLGRSRTTPNSPLRVVSRPSSSRGTTWSVNWLSRQHGLSTRSVIL